MFLGLEKAKPDNPDPMTSLTTYWIMILISCQSIISITDVMISFFTDLMFALIVYRSDVHSHYPSYHHQLEIRNPINGILLNNGLKTVNKQDILLPREKACH